MKYVHLQKKDSILIVIIFHKTRKTVFKNAFLTMNF